MANQNSAEGSSSGNVPVESSDTTVQINIKTLESQIHSFLVDKNILVSSFKEKIANKIAVPVGQQRLIFRGKVLKDEHPLSEYHVENGHTLHLVARQPAQSQDSSGASSENSGNNNRRVNDASAGAPRHRVGQMSHSVVLGTLNVGDQGEGGVPDISRVIGAVLNSIGIGNQPMANVNGGFQSINMPNNPGNPLGNGTEGANRTVGGQTQAGNQAQSGQAFPSLPQVLQIPLAAAAVPLPTMTSPIPSSLTTISEFMNHMEQAVSQNGNHSDTSPNSLEDVQRVELPSNAQGLHTPEALSIVLRQAERLLSNQAVASLAHIAGRLEQERESSDLSTRGQIQAESVRLGVVVQHLGALFLELGRTILTLRMGQSAAESVVNSGPSVYISPSGPNPIMAQPFPLQTSSLFGGSVPTLNPMAFGPAGIATGPRNVNIHIHTGTSLAPMMAQVGTRGSNVDGLQGDRTTGTGSAGSAASRGLPIRNIGTPAATQPTSGVSNLQPPSNSGSLSSLLAEVNSQIRGQVESNIPNTSTPSVSTSATVLSGDVNSSVTLPRSVTQEGYEDAQGVSGSEGDLSCSDKDSDSFATGQRNHEENAPGSSKKHDAKEDAKAVPLGLGLGGLDRKRRVKQQQPQTSSNDSGTATDSSKQNQETRSNQQVSERVPGGQGSVGVPDMASLMSQVLDNPAVSDLLTGVSEQTGMGSPNVLRNMLQQFSQNPQMRNVVDQIAQQVDTREIENMMEGQGGGGIDMSRMFQQMMPIVSRALGASGATLPQPRSLSQQPQTLPQYSRRVQSGYENNDQGLQSVARVIGGTNAPEDVFRAVVENSIQVSSGESGLSGVVDELCSDDELVKEYLDLLATEMRRRIQD